MISVIICTYNRDKYIYNVLESIAGNDFPTEGYEIVLVNNNCTDNTAAEVERFASTWPQVRLRCFTETNQGLSFARNRGIMEAEGDILVYVDDDALVNGTFLSNYAGLFSRRNDIFAAGGPIVPIYEDAEEPAWMTYHLKRLLTGHLFFGDRERKFPRGSYPGGGNAAYRAGVFKEVGLFNVSLGRNGKGLGGGEEKDIFSKMTAAGLPFVYTPGSVLYHLIPHYKLEEDYFDRVTCGIGQSERERTLAVSKVAYLGRLLAEAAKWGGTLALCCLYILQGRLECAKKLLRFRRNVTGKLLFHQ